MLSAIALVMTGLLGLVIAFVVSKGVAAGARKMLDAARGIAEGDVDQDVDVRSRDEIGKTAEAFREMVAYLKELADAAQRMAEGDLTVEVRARSERDLLGNSFRKLVCQLRAMVTQVSATAGTVDLASKDMASTSVEAGRATGEIASAVSAVTSGAERQVQAIESARHSAADVARAVKESAASAQQTAGVAAETRQAAREGVVAAEQATEPMQAVRASSASVTEAIRGLAAKSEQIGAIVKTITGIAEQTNLLALNAAIEAARQASRDADLRWCQRRCASSPRNHSARPRRSAG